MNLNTTTLDDEVHDYDSVIRPYLEHFITNNVVNSLNFGFDESCRVTYIKFISLFSDNFFQRWKEKYIIKSIQKKNLKEKKLNIKKTVHSYKFNFLKFNFDCSYYEEAREEFQKIANTVVYVREIHKTIKNRNIEKHWKHD